MGEGRSLYPIQHRSTEVRKDLLVLRARDALMASRQAPKGSKVHAAVDTPAVT
jgi:hypothetical protein